MHKSVELATSVLIKAIVIYGCRRTYTTSPVTNRSCVKLMIYIKSEINTPASYDVVRCKIPDFLIFSTWTVAYGDRAAVMQEQPVKKPTCNRF